MNLTTTLVLEEQGNRATKPQNGCSLEEASKQEKTKGEGRGGLPPNPSHSVGMLIFDLVLVETNGATCAQQKRLLIIWSPRQPGFL